MKVQIDTNDGIVSIDVDKISYIRSRKQPYGDSNKYEVIININGGYGDNFEFENTEEANEFVRKITKLMEDKTSISKTDSRIEVSQPKTYIDGFKDGCEYTLKLKNKES